MTTSMLTICPAPSLRFVVMRRSLLLALLAFLLARTEGAHSRRRPIVRYAGQQVKYDRAITTFSPDGRLQQVEYGLEAANRGESVVTALVNKTMAIIALRGTDKLHRIDSHILLATAGLAGDGRALASALRTSCQRHLLSYGETPTVKEVAEYAARLQHDLTKTAGARPLGCTGIVIGVTSSRRSDTAGEVQIYQTDPGGVMEQCIYCVAGKRNHLILKSLVERSGDTEEVTGETAFSLTSKILSSIAEVESEDSSGLVDLWIIRADHGKRGNMGLLCAKGVSRESLDADLAFLSN